MSDHEQHDKDELLLRSAFEKITLLNLKLSRYDEPIAIIGMSCRFPGGANSPEEYWNLLERGGDAISPIPSNRWDANMYYDHDLGVPGKMINKLGGFLNVDISKFDTTFFKISPIEAEYLDPQQRLLLEVSYEAVQSAGIDPASLEGSATGVFIGMCTQDYMDLITATGDVTLINPYMATGNFASTASGRISYFFGLQGPSFALDTACSSSLVAIDEACKNLRCGDANLAFVGGVNLMLSPNLTINFSKSGMLAADGHCKTFDASADGYVRGEGCGMVLLKRLSEAKRDGNRILGIIKASGVNQDGASSGLTVPNGEAQEALIRKVLRKANLKGNEVDYIEAHGTGTSLGDPIEVRAIGATYGEREEAYPIKLGSVKTNIGHLEGASGIAGLIKVLLSLQHEMLPKHLHFTTLNPNIDMNFPAEILNQNTPWRRGERVRRAGVSSFGFSGTNAHLIIEEGPVELSNKTPGPYFLPLSAKKPLALEKGIKDLKQFLEMHPDINMADVAYTLQLGRAELTYRTFLVCDSLPDAVAKLSTLTEFTEAETGSGEKFDFTPQLLQDQNKQNLLNRVGKAWVSGQSVNWPSYYKDRIQHFISLPTYPFVGKSYWVKALETKMNKTTLDFPNNKGDKNE